MAASFAATLDRVIQQCRQVLDNTTTLRHEIYDEYAILHLQGVYKQYRINIREVIRNDESRKYSYYVFENTQVVTGFDNAPDPRALTLKYGPASRDHRLEAVPHQHSASKTTISLTDEIDCVTFIRWLQHNL